MPNGRRTGLSQRIQGEISWPLYIRLKGYAKRTKEQISSIVGVAVKEYLDRKESDAETQR